MANEQETDSVEQRVYDALTFDGDGKLLPTDETALRSRTLMTILIEILLTKRILTNAELDNLLFRLGRNQVFNAVKKSESTVGEMDDLRTNDSKRKPELPPSPEHAF